MGMDGWRGWRPSWWNGPRCRRSPECVIVETHLIAAGRGRAVEDGGGGGVGKDLPLPGEPRHCAQRESMQTIFPSWCCWPWVSLGLRRRCWSSWGWSKNVARSVNSPPFLTKELSSHLIFCFSPDLQYSAGADGQGQVRYKRARSVRCR